MAKKRIPPRVKDEFNPPSSGSMIDESLLAFEEMRKRFKGKSFFDLFKDEE